MQVRLQKFIADCGVTSRRKAEDLIVQGRVEVNGETITELGTKVNAHEDAVVVDGKGIDLKQVKQVYILMNKPRGYVTTLSDPEGRNTVMDMLREFSERIYPVGRLDYLSEGLLLFTNDGEIANWVMHPSREVIKVYEVKVFGAVDQNIIKRLRAGAQLEDGFAKPRSVRVIKQLPQKTWLEFRLGEGRNREIRKLCEAAGLTVDKLRRVSIGALSVEGIRPGSYKTLSRKKLLDGLGLDSNGMQVGQTKEYWSDKKTVNLRRRGVQNCTAADNESFTKFRRESYFDTVKELKERRKEERRQEYNQKLQTHEDAHQKRVVKKAKRVQKKNEERSNSHVHAQFVK